ncbi:MAG TPA: HEAT repeat domain-containing protein [Xanthomonadaceae bacterium]|nr:HEAT repeat domain-containing protein [Xanthomonadaceae bacterium]
MDFLSGADAKLVFAFWLGVVVVCVAVIMLLVIVGMRQAMLRKQRIHDEAARVWGAILSDVVHGSAADVPRLARADVSGFIEAWNQLHAALPPGGSPPLRKAAGQAGAGDQLRAMLDRGGFHDRVVAIIALGHLRERDDFDRLARFLHAPSAIVSLSAARALMQVDNERAVALFVPQIVARLDWSQSGVAEILREADTAIVSRELGEVALQANAEAAPRLVRFLADISPTDAAPVIRRILQSSQDEHLISTCLQVLEDPRDLHLVRGLLGRERWHVRMHAATALGRLGEKDDEWLLLPMLSDAQWWVRYRAAQALVRLFRLHSQDPDSLRGGLVDPYARDILDQVLAEQRLGVQR